MPNNSKIQDLTRQIRLLIKLPLASRCQKFFCYREENVLFILVFLSLFSLQKNSFQQRKESAH